jgi:proteasome lid subunit RPN8/RPN11
MAAPKQNGVPMLQVSTEVARQIRQHARSNRKTEICGVLIGRETSGITKVEACIAGESAAQGGAHVTFTQDTWEHIYKIKDRDYPDERIVGWYHLHPGFGDFLSDHDTFIHKNFFSSPTQIAWVYDPHSDEEGCFGWRNGRLERVGEFEFVDGRGGERADATGKAEPVADDFDDDPEPATKTRTARKPAKADDDLDKLTRIVSGVFSYLAIFALGAFFVWYLMPHILVVPVPVDANTGRPLQGFLDRDHEAVGYWLNGPSAGKRAVIPLGPMPEKGAEMPPAKLPEGVGPTNPAAPDAEKNRP